MANEEAIASWTPADNRVRFMCWACPRLFVTLVALFKRIILLNTKVYVRHGLSAIVGLILASTGGVAQSIG